MDGVEEQEGEEHEHGVEDVSVSFGLGDCAARAAGEFNHSVDDTDLEGRMLVGPY